MQFKLSGILMIITTTIKPPTRFGKFDFAEIWRYRELFYIFTWRDVKVRYKQTYIGIAWAIFQPLMTMVIFDILFGRLAKVPSDGIPYPIFVYSGLLLWNYFSSALSSASNSLANNENIVKKVYFPRLILPLSSVITPLVDFFFSFIILLALMAYYHFVPSLLVFLLLPLLLLILLLASAGLGLLLAAVNVKYRDIRYLLPFFIQIFLYLTPIIYPVSIIPAKYQWLLSFNPAAGPITALRSLLFHTSAVNWQSLLLAFAVTLVLVFIGTIAFCRSENNFADII